MADLRIGLRNFSRNPGFFAIVILILALGIGANTAIFSIVDGVLLRPLPFHDPDRLFAVQEALPKLSNLAQSLPVSAYGFTEWRKQWQSAEQIAIFNTYSVNLTSGGEPERLNMGRASADLFPLLGVQPQIGRNFLASEDRPGRDQVVILSDALWQRRFHGDRSILGRKILIDGAPYEVIGVLPPGLVLPKVSQLQSLHYGDVNPDLWKPLALRDSELVALSDWNFAGLVRLKRGVSKDRALDELNAIQAGIARRTVSQPIELRAKLVPLQSQIAGRSRQGLWMLLAAVGVVFLIVCVNIANLLLVRATGRRREFAIRSAVGASPGRLMRQAMAESLVLAALGGALGIALAYSTLGAIVANAPTDLPRVNQIHIDARVLAAAILLTLGSALLFGLLPAWRCSRTDPRDGLQSGARGATEGRHGGRVRSLLVCAEVTMTTICLAAAGLLLNSFVRLMHVDLGFDAERVTSVELSFPAVRYAGTPQRAELIRKLLDQIHSLPGVTSAAVSNMLPLAGEGINNTLFVDGRNLPLLEEPIADRRTVSEDYFRTMSIPIEQGRIFEPEDRVRRVAIISSATARQLWPGENPLGRALRMGNEHAPLLQVIGVVGDVRSSGLEKAPVATVYLPYWQRDQREMSLMVRTAKEPGAMSGGIRAVIRKLDPELPVPAFKTMREIVSESVAQRKFQLTLVLLFAGIALALASLGIYGVVSYAVEQRSGELGIRMALGATPLNLRLLMLRQGLTPVLPGLAIGVVGALAAGRAFRTLLFGVRPNDPLTLAAVAAVLLSVAAAACYFPALRATRADPLTVLRHE